MVGGPSGPGGPDPGPSRRREEIEESEEYQSLQDNLESLGEMIAEWDEETAAKEAASFNTVPPEQVDVAEALMGTLLVTGLGTVSLAYAYHPSARRNRDDGSKFESEIVVNTVTLDPGDNEHSERGRVSGHFITKFEGVMGAEKFAPNSPHPDMDDYPGYTIREMGSFAAEDHPHIEEYVDRLKRGEYEDMILGATEERVEVDIDAGGDEAGSIVSGIRQLLDVDVTDVEERVNGIAVEFTVPYPDERVPSSAFISGEMVKEADIRIGPLGDPRTLTAAEKETRVGEFHDYVNRQADSAFDTDVISDRNIVVDTDGDMTARVTIDRPVDGDDFRKFLFYLDAGFGDREEVIDTLTPIEY